MQPPPAAVVEESKADTTVAAPAGEKAETDSDDEYKDIDIKKKLKEHKAAHAGERFPIELINDAVRWRLNQNDCQNRGYVLDGYPRNYEEAAGVFLIQNKRPEPKFVVDEATGEKV